MGRQIDAADTEKKLEEIGRRLEKFHDTLESLTIYAGFVSSDPDLWEFKFRGEVRPVKVSATALGNPIAFRAEYIQVFKRPAPGIRGGNWDTLLALWADRAEHKQSMNPSQAVLDALMVYECILELPATGNPVKNRCCMIPTDRPDIRLVHSKVINWIKNRNNIFTSQEDLNKVLVELGYKEDGYRQKKLDKQNAPRFWWFIVPEGE